jgi:hypothetical protein
LDSVFESNVCDFDHHTGMGIVVDLGGQAICHANEDCLPFCTVCEEDSLPEPDASEASGVDSGVLLLVAALAVLPIFVCGMLAGRKYLQSAHVERSRDPGIEMDGASTLLEPILDRSRVDVESTGASVYDTLTTARKNATPETDRQSSSNGSDDSHASHGSGRVTDVLLQSVLGCSPAPIFVIGRNLHIMLWSPGMEIAAPLLANPVGRHFRKLPFVKKDEQAKLEIYFKRIFDEPGKHASVQTVMMHLYTRSGPVLLEMLSTVVSTESVAGLERDDLIIVLTGREVEHGLAGLIACESIVSGNDADDDNSDGRANHGTSINSRNNQGSSIVYGILGPSVSVANDDAGEERRKADDRESQISAVTMPDELLALTMPAELPASETPIPRRPRGASCDDRALDWSTGASNTSKTHIPRSDSSKTPIPRKPRGASCDAQALDQSSWASDSTGLSAFVKESSAEDSGGVAPPRARMAMAAAWTSFGDILARPFLKIDDCAGEGASMIASSEARAARERGSTGASTVASEGSAARAVNFLLG